MKNKEFDCVQMKLNIQEALWIEAGETFDGLIALHEKRLKDNELYKYLINRQEKSRQHSDT